MFHIQTFHIELELSVYICQLQRVVCITSSVVIYYQCYIPPSPQIIQYTNGTLQYSNQYCINTARGQVRLDSENRRIVIQ